MGGLLVSRSFLILHGLGGSGPDHWQTWLYHELIKYGEQAYYPDFPEPDHPIKNDWLERLHMILSEIPEEDELIVVAHSLACILWFHYATSSPKRKANKAILVSPPSLHTNFDAVNTFFPLPTRLSDSSKGAEKTVIIQSSNDPYCCVEDTIYYQDLGIPHVTLPKMGHINTESGQGPWQLILDLSLKGSVTLI